MATIMVLLFVVPMLSLGQVSAEADIGLEEAGITMVALGGPWGMPGAPYPAALGAPGPQGGPWGAPL